MRWLRRAAIQGDERAQHNLGVNYANGTGVPQDLVTAHMWLSLAASVETSPTPGDSAAARDIIAARLTPAELVESSRRQRNWTPVAERK